MARTLAEDEEVRGESKGESLSLSFDAPATCSYEDIEAPSNGGLDRPRNVEMELESFCRGFGGTGGLPAGVLLGMGSTFRSGLDSEPSAE